jgi:hypothetical protein
MKPMDRCDADRRRFPITDFCFQSGMGEWRSYSSPYDGDDDSEIRKFHDFSRASMAESRRERATEMAVFALVVLASAWPVIYMVVTVVKLLLRGRPLTE